MDFYSVTLGLALAATSLELVLAILYRLAPDGVTPSRFRSTIRRVGVGAGAGALLLLVSSVIHHVAVGHTPGSSSGMSPAVFVAEHPAFPITAALAAAGFALLRRTQCE